MFKVSCSFDQSEFLSLLINKIDSFLRQQCSLPKAKYKCQKSAECIDLYSFVSDKARWAILGQRETYQMQECSRVITNLF